MAKKIAAYMKLQIPAGKATPAPPVGPALGQHSVNIMDFCKAFNAKTSAKDPGRPDHPGCHHCLCGPVVFIYHKNSARFDSAEAGLRNCQGVRRAEQEQGRKGDGKAGRGHCQAQDA